MFDKSLKYSFAAKKRKRHRLLRTLLLLLIIFVFYNLITSFLLSAWVLQNNTMQPSLRAGDRFLVVSTALPSLVADIRGTDLQRFFYRGSIVLIDTDRGRNQNLFLTAIDGIVRFFTAQQVSIISGEERIFMKRLIALPGDEVSMSDFIMRVKPSGGMFALTEFELSERSYVLNIPQTAALWDASLPFSGNMEPFILGADEYFVVSDDRSSSGDSRTWGPVPSRYIIGRPVFRFWPLNRMGRP